MYCDNLFLYFVSIVIFLLPEQLLMNITNYICISCLVLCCKVCFYIMLKVISGYVDIVVYEK